MPNRKIQNLRKHRTLSVQSSRKGKPSRVLAGKSIPSGSSVLTCLQQYPQKVRQAMTSPSLNYQQEQANLSTAEPGQAKPPPATQLPGAGVPSACAGGVNSPGVFWSSTQHQKATQLWYLPIPHPTAENLPDPMASALPRGRRCPR